jgi:hypothetical protein
LERLDLGERVAQRLGVVRPHRGERRNDVGPAALVLAGEGVQCVEGVGAELGEAEGHGGFLSVDVEQNSEHSNRIGFDSFCVVAMACILVLLAGQARTGGPGELGWVRGEG